VHSISAIKLPVEQDIIAKVDQLNEDAVQLERISPAEMLATAEQARTLAASANYAKGIAWSMALIGKAHFRLGNLTEADQVLSEVQSLGALDPSVEAEFYNTRGIVYLYLKTYDKAFSYYQQSLSLARSTGNRALEARLLNNIGEIYREHKDFNTALDYYFMSLDAQNEMAAYNAKSVPIANIASTYLEMGDMANAQLYAEEAVRIAREQNDQMVESAGLQYLGIISRKLGQRGKAAEYLSKSLAIYRDTQEVIHAVETMMEFYKLYSEDGDNELSLKYLHQALTTAEETDSLSLRAGLYVELAKTYESCGNIQKALHYHKHYQDTITAIDAADREQRLRAIGVQIAADESYKEKEAYRALNKELDKKAQELQEAYLTLQAISDIGKNITATLNLENVFALVHHHLQDLMETDVFGIGLYNQEDSTVEFHYVMEDGEKLGVTPVSLDDPTSFAVACFKQKKGFVVNSLEDEDISGYVDRIGSYEGDMMRAFMFQPLTVEGETIGVITVQSRKDRVYSERTLGVLAPLSSYLSIAIQNARKSEKLYEEIRERQLAQQELEHLNRELANLSNLDGLTDIANRRRLDEFLQHTWYTALRQKLEVSLFMIDVDYLKEYNDHYGHLAGDEVIKQIAQALQRSIKRRTDLVARYGGDEFVVVLGATNALHALHAAREIQAEVAQLAILHEASPIGSYLTLSIGVTTIKPGQDTNPSDLIARSDLALYQAKQGGRDRIEVVDHP